MFFWWGAAIVVALSVVLVSLGEFIRLSGRRLRMALVRPVSYVIVALFGAVSFSAMLGLSRDDPYSAFRLAVVFLLIWIATVIGAVNIALVRRYAARSGGSIRLSPFLMRISEPPPEVLPDAVLGTPRAPIDVTAGFKSLTITVPVRRSSKVLATGLMFMAPAAFLLGRMVYVIVGGTFGGLGASGVALGVSLGVMGNLLMNIPFWLAALWGAHLIFGEEVVTAEPHRLMVRKTVWGIGTPGGILDVDRSAIARPERNQSAQWTVVIELAPVIAGVPRHVQFGAGALSHDQAQALADVITKQYAEMVGSPGLSV